MLFSSLGSVNCIELNNPVGIVRLLHSGCSEKKSNSL